MVWHFKARDSSPLTCARWVSWLRLLANPASILNQPLSSVVKRGKTLALLAALRNHSLALSPAFFALPSIKILSVGVNLTISILLRLTVFFGLPGTRFFVSLLLYVATAMRSFLSEIFLISYFILFKNRPTGASSGSSL